MSMFLFYKTLIICCLFLVVQVTKMVFFLQDCHSPFNFPSLLSKCSGEVYVFTHPKLRRLHSGDVALSPGQHFNLENKYIPLVGYVKCYRPLMTIILSAFLFGLVHLNPVQFMTAFPLGIFFGWLYYKTESVLPCILGDFSVHLMGFYLRFTLKTKDFWQEIAWNVSR